MKFRKETRGWVLTSYFAVTKHATGKNTPCDWPMLLDITTDQTVLIRSMGVSSMLVKKEICPLNFS